MVKDDTRPPSAEAGKYLQIRGCKGSCDMPRHVPVHYGSAWQVWSWHKSTGAACTCGTLRPQPALLPLLRP